MRLRDSTRSYGLVAKVLHWATLLLVLEQLSLAWTWSGRAPAVMDRMIDLHRSVGLAILAATVLRIAWQLANRRPSEPRLPAWQNMGAHVLHVAFYGLLVAIPLAGWAHSSAVGYDARLLGVTMPRLLPLDRHLGDLTADLHRVLALGMVGLVTIHVLAAVRHALLGDGVMRRMI